jgi:hypothetical protein
VITGVPGSGTAGNNDPVTVVIQEGHCGQDQQSDTIVPVAPPRRSPRLGLPISGAAVESVIRQMNRRKKGTENF